MAWVRRALVRPSTRFANNKTAGPLCFAALRSQSFAVAWIDRRSTSVKPASAVFAV